MKNPVKSLFAFLMTAMLAFSAASCGGPEKPQGSNEVEKVSFPLTEPVDYTFMVQGTQSAVFKTDLEKNKLWKKLKDATNVHINFQFLGDKGSDKLALLINSGDYGDVIWGGPILTSVEASKYIAAEKLIKLSDYITADLMPNFSNLLKESPETQKAIKATDGEIYTLPKYTGLKGYYLESPIWVNKAWLDKLGIAVPKTLNQFTAMLRAFATQDPNGNGLADEIPYICSTSDGFMHPEALLGIFGLATKSDINDSFVQVKDGKVLFVPQLDAYKAATKYLSTLYKEGLMWQEVFTSNLNTLYAKLSSPTCVVGCFTNKEPVETSYEKDYVCIAPPKADGYDASWYYHPALTGSKNQFFVTDKCKNVSVLMAWVDQLYDLENALAMDYGFPGEDLLNQDSNGKYSFIEIDDPLKKQQLAKDNPVLSAIIGNSIRSISVSDYENRINLGDSEKIMQNNYEIYKDIINKEIWPRPYYLPEDAYDADVLTTDIFYHVNTYRAKWITGGSNIEDEWEGYVKKLNSLGIGQFISILQKSYDNYLKY